MDVCCFAHPLFIYERMKMMYKKIIDNYIKSNEMKEYLSNTNLNNYTIMNIVCSSPVPITEKIIGLNDLKQLAISSNNMELLGWVYDAIWEYEKAMDLLSLEGVFTIESFSYDIDDHEVLGKLYNVASSFEEINELIREAMVYSYKESYDWFYLKKWIKDSDGKFKNTSRYIIVNNVIYYIGLNIRDYNHIPWFNHSSSINVPTPFLPGDIVSVDLFPFIPKFPLLLISIGNIDSCSLIGMSRDNHGLWYIDTIYHNNIGPDTSYMVSPIFTIETYHDELPDEDKECLVKFSKYIKNNMTRSSDIAMFLIGKHIKQEDLLAWIHDGCLTTNCNNPKFVI